MKLYVDLDGVLRDWNGGIEKLFDVEFKMKHWSDWKSLAKAKGISHTEFWNKQDDKFWSHLDFTPWAGPLLDALAPYKPIICTSPTYTSAGGTQAWIKNMMPDYFHENRYIITRNKAAVAGPKKLLIDDHEGHYYDWLNEGGWAILFPAPWNNNAGIKDKVGYTMANVKQIYGYEGIELNDAA